MARYRLVERPYETIERRRYAIEGLRCETQDGEGFWGIERFFGDVLEAQLYLAKLVKGDRVIREIEVTD